MPKDNPVLIPSGYGKVAQYVPHYLQDAGWEVRLHCRIGHEMNVVEWVEPHSGNKYEIWSGGDGMYGESVVPSHVAKLSEVAKKPAHVLFCGDVAGLGPLCDWLGRHEVIGSAWCAVDWEYPTPKHALDRHKTFFRTFPFSHHGHRVLVQDGLQNVLDPVWFGVNPKIWHPYDPSEYPKDAPYDRVMESMGFRRDGFNVFSAFANQFQRKGEYEMMYALREFNRRHPEAKIRFFAFTQVRRDWDLPALAEHMGVKDIVRWSDDYKHIMGAYPEQDVALMMNASDVVLSMGYEGFGLQTCEAQALGKPVIGFNAGATPELLKAGILVPSRKDIMWSPMFRRPLPDEDRLVDALEEMWLAKQEGRKWDNGRKWVHGNLTWDHTGKALVERLEAIEQALADEEIFGPPPPGPLAQRMAKEQVVVE